MVMNPDVEVSGLPLESRIDVVIRDNRRINVELLVKEVQIQEKSAKWVPIQVTEAHKESRLSISQDLKQRSLIKEDAFFERIVTSDEVWIHHYDPETKRQSLEWKPSNCPVRKNSRFNLLPVKSANCQ